MPAAKQPNRPNYTELRKQVADRLSSARRILILTHENPDADALGSGLALSAVLRTLGKSVDFHVYTTGDGVSSTLEFLIVSDPLQVNARLSREFLIKVDRTTSDLTSLRYDSTPEGLTIYLEPGQGGIKPESISLEPGKSPYDLIVSLDSDSKQHLGPAGTALAEHFSDVDILVIDHHASNQGFGALNLIIPKASSTAEIMYSVIELLDPATLTEEVATRLLAGIMGDTNAFQHPNTSQRTLEIVTKLIAAGADKDRIIQKLFHERSTGVLRLWGKILSNLKIESDGLAWSSLSYPELQEESVTEIQSGQLLNDLLSSAKDARVVFLLIEREIGRIQASLRSPGGIDVARFATEHGGGGHRLAAGFTITETSLEDVVRRLLPELRDYLKTQRRGADADQPVAPARAQREGEATDIFDSGLSSRPSSGADFQPSKQPADVVSDPDDTALAEAEIEQAEELLGDPQDYIAPEDAVEPKEIEGEPDDGQEASVATPFSASEYTAPKRQDVGVWTPDQG